MDPIRQLRLMVIVLHFRHWDIFYDHSNDLILELLIRLVSHFALSCGWNLMIHINSSLGEGPLL